MTHAFSAKNRLAFGKDQYSSVDGRYCFIVPDFLPIIISRYWGVKL